MTLVIIEDSRTQRVKLRAHLTAAGHDVVAKSDGLEGLAACIALPEPPLAVITDVLMPGIDGYEVCRRIKAEPRLAKTPVIVLTELTRPADVLRAVEAGADNYCTKPYRPEELLRRMERAIRLARGEENTVVHQGGDSFRIGGGPASRLAEILVSSLSDATARYHELERSQAELEHMGNQREETMRLVAHEVRSPLQALLVGAELAERAPERLQALPKQVRDQSARIVRVVEDLSDLSRLDLGRLRLTRERADLREVLQRGVERVQPSLGEHRVSLRLPDEPLSVEVDPSRIEQVLTNFLTNAAKYSGPAERIEVSAEQRAGAAWVLVRDFGIGILPEEQGRVFDRYFRSESGQQKAEGIGIGLYLSRALVEAHGGAVGVESSPGGGSTFWFQVPLSA